MKKNRDITMLSFLLLTSMSLVPNAHTFASESNLMLTSNVIAKLAPGGSDLVKSTWTVASAWAPTVAFLAIGGLGWRVYSHRRNALHSINRATNEYYSSKPLSDITVEDTYIGSESTASIIRDFNNGNITFNNGRTASCNPVQHSGSSQIRLSQEEFPVVRIKKSAGSQFDNIDNQIRRICKKYQDPYSRQLELYDNVEQNNVQEESSGFFSHWCKPLLKYISSAYRFILYPADGVVRNDKFVKDWPTKKDSWQNIKATLDRDAEDINKRCTYYR